MNTQAIFHFKKMLLNLDACLTKAEAYADAKKFDVNILANARLAPDMFPMTKQIQSACDAAKFCAAYLAEKTPPKHEDNETTWKELHERIAKVVAYLESFSEADFAKADSVNVKPKWAEGKWMPANQYMNEISIPNFYFHVMAAYAILRHSGVDIGKMDYLGKIEMQG